MKTPLDLTESVAGEEDPGAALDIAPSTAKQAFRLGTLPAAQKAQTRFGTLEYVVSGKGSPTIVLLNGAGMSLDGWRALYPAIESMGTVFGWNRFGVDGSAPPAVAQSGGVVMASLRELLRYAGVHPPYLLVGHSLGGLYANLFARLHPAEVAAVLFIEATHPRDHDVLEENESQLTRALSKVFALPQRLFRANLHAEIEWIAETVEEIESAGPFPRVPVGVVTGGTPPPKWLMSEEAVQARREHQLELVRLSPLGRQVIATQSGHFPQLSEPQVVLDMLRDLSSRPRIKSGASASPGIVIPGLTRDP